MYTKDDNNDLFEFIDSLGPEIDKKSMSLFSMRNQIAVEILNLGSSKMVY